MPETPDPPRTSSLAGLSADLKQVAGAVGWLAGVMSGVVALMYAVGFLCAKSHLNMLGIELYSGLAAGAYVEIGAKFFYITLIMLFEGLVDLGRGVLPVLAMGLVPVVLLIALAGALLARVRRDSFRNTMRRGYARLRQWRPDSRPGQVMLSGLLVLVLLWAGSQYQAVFTPVRVSGVLHGGCQDAPGGSPAELLVSRLTCKIRGGEAGATHGYYSGLLSLMFGLFLVVVPFRRRFLGRGATRIVYIPLVILFAIYLLVLPLNYGALVMPNAFPQVNLQTQQSAEVDIPEGPFFLIHQGDKFLILWHAARGASYVIPSAAVTTLEVIDRASLFADPLASAQSPKQGDSP